ncbi:Similar to Uncharacterized RING finger protein C328.02; acc. no. Q9P3U4 [Pyronema omphalodes CBS 100304]|uniref:RBR-type E3 ubiquitin transferase n=1 Tax=Pyronema omphalodes (strain CBS 100304) TaxID=1076935 RepID=U4LLI1_PYROM|nr:Similar to Uncharacterized RING finger protein C328.02; acc. no. Q9P3U4 [Pyronema omphalodes CBS 100304]
MTKSDLPPSPTATFSSAFSSASSMTGRSIEYHDKDAILHQLRTLEAELRDTTDIGFDFTLTNSHEGEWWKKDAPPQELTLLTAEEPIELEAVVIAFYEVIESYTIARKEKEKEVALSKNAPEVSLHDAPEVVPTDAPEVVPDQAGLEVVEQADKALQPLVEASRLRRPSLLSIRDSRRNSVATSVCSKSSSERKKSVSYNRVKQRSVDHGILTASGMMYSPFFTMPNNPGGPPVVMDAPVSPVKEAIMKKWNGFKEARTAKDECCVCLDDHLKKKLHTLPCTHMMCEDDLRQTIKTALANAERFPPACCRELILKETIKRVLNKKDYACYKQRAKEYFLPECQRLYCPNPACSIWIPPNKMKVTGPDEIKCHECNRKICRHCKQNSHPQTKICPKDVAVEKVLNMAAKNGWKRCPHCNTVVDKLSNTCRHVVCKCGKAFCYHCGRKWGECGCAKDYVDNAHPRLPEQINVVDEEREERERARAIADVEALQARDRAARLARTAAYLERIREEGELRLSIIAERRKSMEGKLEMLLRMQREAMYNRHLKERQGLEQQWNAKTHSMALDLRMRIDNLDKQEVERERKLIEVQEKIRVDLGKTHENAQDDFWFELRNYLKGQSDAMERKEKLVNKLREEHAVEAKGLVKRQEEEKVELQRTISEEFANLLNTFQSMKNNAFSEELARRRDSSVTWSAEKVWMQNVAEERSVKLLTPIDDEETAAKLLITERRREIELRAFDPLVV